MSFEIPKKIHDAIKSGDAAFLSAAGKKGAEAAAEAKKKARAIADEMTVMMNEIETERAQLDEEFRKRQANEHIISPDGEALEYEDDEVDKTYK